MRSEVDLQAFAESAFARGWDVCFPCMVRDEAAVLVLNKSRYGALKD